jgi:hypothetical protein
MPTALMARSGQFGEVRREEDAEAEPFDPRRVFVFLLMLIVRCFLAEQSYRQKAAGRIGSRPACRGVRRKPDHP